MPLRGPRTSVFDFGLRFWKPNFWWPVALREPGPGLTPKIDIEIIEPYGSKYLLKRYKLPPNCTLSVHSEQRILGSIGEWYFEYYFVTRVEKNLLRQPSEDSSKNIDPGPKTFNDKTPMDPTFFGVPTVSHKKIPHDFVDFRQHSSGHGFVSRWKIKTPRLFSSKNQAAWKSPAPDSTEAKSFRKKKTPNFCLSVTLRDMVKETDCCYSHLANGPWKKSLNFIFPTKYGIPKSLKG